MTVEKLIEELRRFDPEAEVRMNSTPIWRLRHADLDQVRREHDPRTQKEFALLIEEREH